MTFEDLTALRMRILQGEEVSMEELRQAIASIREARHVTLAPKPTKSKKQPSERLEKLLGLLSNGGGEGK
jgi:hypothetical protein